MYGRTPEAADARQTTTYKAMQTVIGSCREWLPEKADNCNAPTEYVLWGKLIPTEALGPRCYDHAAEHVGHRALGDPAWAIIDLWKLAEAIDEAHCA